MYRLLQTTPPSSSRNYYPRLIAGTNLPTPKGWIAWLAKADCTHITYYTIESKGTGRKWTQVVESKTNSIPMNQPAVHYRPRIKCSDSRSLWRKVGTLQSAAAPVGEHSAMSFTTFFCNKVDNIRETNMNAPQPTIHHREVPPFGRFQEVMTDVYSKFFGLHQTTSASSIQHRHGSWSRWVMS